MNGAALLVAILLLSATGAGETVFGVKKVALYIETYMYMYAQSNVSDTPLNAAFGQNVVDKKNCEERNIHCPKDGEPSYKTYCCLESNGGLALYSCCNPYFGLATFAIGINLQSW